MTCAVVTLCSVLLLVFVVSWWSSRSDEFRREAAAEPQRTETGASPSEGQSSEESNGENEKNEQ